MLLYNTVLSFNVFAQTPPSADELKNIQRNIITEKSAAEAARARSETMARDIGSLQSELVSAARAVQQHEHQVEIITARMTALEELRDTKEAELRDSRKKFARVLSAMQRIAQFPPEALVAQPTAPADTVRTAILLRAAVGEIDKQAVALREEVEFLAKARAEIASRAESLRATTELLDRERRRLGALMSRKKVLKRRADKQAYAAEQRALALAKKAKSLKELLAGLEANKKLQAATPPASVSGDGQASQQVASITPRQLRKIGAARGKLNLPAIGRVVGRYGEKTEGGLARKGVTIATRNTAQIVATFDGIVAYAGKFRGYGLLLIIEHSEGYHSLLAGMSRIDVTQGQQLIAGEPVGVIDKGSDSEPVLYVELRRNGQPINPIPWLAARKNEVNG